MPKYSYTARDRSGQTVTSTLEAPSRKDALRALAARGLQLQGISEAGGAATSPAPKSQGTKSKTKTGASALPQPAVKNQADAEKKLTRKERLPFLEALYDLVASGLSAGESLRMLSQRMRDPKLRALCAGLWERVSEGATLSRAMADLPHVFDAQTTNLIQAGEATGGLGEVLQRLITHLTEQREMRRQFVNAIIYPVLLLTMAFGLVLFLMFFLIPQMQSLFTALGGKLPAATRFLIGMADFSLHYGPFILGILVFGGIAFWRWRKTPGGRLKTDGWLLIPTPTRSFASSQTVLAFSQTLSVLLENGITTTEALKITEKQISNTVHKNAFTDASARVREGEALSSALQRTDCFPPLVLDQLAIGENTGSLVPSLKKISASYRKIVSTQLTTVMNAVTSIILAFTFSFIGFIAYAIVSAIFTMSSSFK